MDTTQVISGQGTGMDWSLLIMALMLVATVIFGILAIRTAYGAREEARRANQIANGALEVAKKANEASTTPRLIAREGRRLTPGKTREQERVVFVKNLGPGTASNIRLEATVRESQGNEMRNRESQIRGSIRQIEKEWGAGKAIMGPCEREVLPIPPGILHCVSIKASFRDVGGKCYSEDNIVQ